MNIRTGVTAGLTTLAALAGTASAAEFEYSFLSNVVDPGYSLNRVGTVTTVQLDAPFANLTVADEADGIRISYATTGSVSGKISHLAFNFHPELSGLDQGYSDGAYFYTDYSTAFPYYFVGSYGIDFANEDVTLSEIDWGPFAGKMFATINEGASPSFFTFGLDTTTVLSDSFTMHLRGLPAGTTAADIVPKYVRVINASYGSIENGGRAVILASPVPEASIGTLLLIGLGALSLAARRQSPR